MSTELDTWERNHFVEGGGDSFLFYVVFGKIDLSAPLSRGKYRSNGCPEGIEMMSYGPTGYTDVAESFCNGDLWDKLSSEEPDLAEIVRQCNHCVILRGTPTDASTLDYLRDTVGIITHFLDHGGAAIYDPFMFQWWHPSVWRKKVFEPAAASVPRQHAVILVSEEADPSMKWFHTRGMRKFGRPDISVHNVSPELEQGVIDLCDRLMTHQAFGHIVPDGQEVRMAALPTGTIRHEGDLNDPDFNNVHLHVKLESFS